MMTQILKTVADVREFRTAHSGASVALVPTMGNLHEGHLTLMRTAQQHADTVLVSIFVNPTQFAPHEDLNNYPRTFDADLEKLQQLGINAVFYPEESTIYPQGKDHTISIELPNSLTDILCGIDRPTHFQGVATVVAKLLQITTPDVAVFGEKDFQQLTIIRHLVRELFMPTQIIGVGTVRESNGLAMSSRNQYLNDEAFEHASWLSKTLQHCKERLLSGENISMVIAEGKAILAAQQIQVDYLDFRDDKHLQALSDADDITRGVLLLAARLGKTRLIDNLRVREK